jgi:hypothetical protein
MPRILVAALALIAGGPGNLALAQSSDNPDGSAGTPTLILKGTLTNPLTSGLDSGDYGNARAPIGSETPDATSEAPYSVEGEETLDPDTN